MQATSAVVAPKEPALKNARRLLRMQEMGLVIVIILMSIFLYLQAENNSRDFFPKTITNGAGQQIELPAMHAEENKFLNANNIVQIVLTQMSWMAVMGIGVTIVIIAGGIDISVGSVMGFSALACAASLEVLGPDAPPWLGLAVGIGVPLGVGLACGLINGILVVGLRMHPFIVTLSTMSIFRWACLKMAKLGTLPSGDHVLSTSFTDHFIAWQTTFSRYGGRMSEVFQPVPILVMLLCLAAGWVYLRLSVWGRETYAIGGNEEAARFSGIRVPWAKIRVYAISGLCAGIAGMLNCGFYKSASTSTGYGYELAVIAAAAVGGASMLGGRGTALGAVLGTLIIQLIYDGTRILSAVTFGFPPRHLLDLLGLGKTDQWFHFNLFPVSTGDSLLYNGVSILVAVAIDQFSQYLQKRRQTRAKG